MQQNSYTPPFSPSGPSNAPYFRPSDDNQVAPQGTNHSASGPLGPDSPPPGLRVADGRTDFFGHGYSGGHNIWTQQNYPVGRSLGGYPSAPFSGNGGYDGVMSTSPALHHQPPPTYPVNATFNGGVGQQAPQLPTHVNPSMPHTQYYPDQSHMQQLPPFPDRHQQVGPYLAPTPAIQHLHPQFPTPHQGHYYPPPPGIYSRSYPPHPPLAHPQPMRPSAARYDDPYHRPQEPTASHFAPSPQSSYQNQLPPPTSEYPGFGVADAYYQAPEPPRVPAEDPRPTQNKRTRKISMENSGREDSEDKRARYDVDVGADTTIDSLPANDTLPAVNHAVLPNGDQVEGFNCNFQALVTPENWDQVQKKPQKQRRARDANRSTSSTPSTLLSGLPTPSSATTRSSSTTPAAPSPALNATRPASGASGTNKPPLKRKSNSRNKGKQNPSHSTPSSSNMAVPETLVTQSSESKSKLKVNGSGEKKKKGVNIYFFVANEALWPFVRKEKKERESDGRPIKGSIDVNGGETAHHFFSLLFHLMKEELLEPMKALEREQLLEGSQNQEPVTDTARISRLEPFVPEPTLRRIKEYVRRYFDDGILPEECESWRKQRKKTDAAKKRAALKKAAKAQAEASGESGSAAFPQHGQPSTSESNTIPPSSRPSLTQPAIKSSTRKRRSARAHTIPVDPAPPPTLPSNLPPPPPVFALAPRTPFSNPSILPVSGQPITTPPVDQIPSFDAQTQDFDDLAADLQREMEEAEEESQESVEESEDGLDDFAADLAREMAEADEESQEAVEESENDLDDFAADLARDMEEADEDSNQELEQDDLAEHCADSVSTRELDPLEQTHSGEAIPETVLVESRQIHQRHQRTHSATNYTYTSGSAHVEQIEAGGSGSGSSSRHAATEAFSSLEPNHTFASGPSHIDDLEFLPSILTGSASDPLIDFEMAIQEEIQNRANEDIHTFSNGLFDDDLEVVTQLPQGGESYQDLAANPRVFGSTPYVESNLDTRADFRRSRFGEPDGRLGDITNMDTSNQDEGGLGYSSDPDFDSDEEPTVPVPQRSIDRKGKGKAN